MEWVDVFTRKDYRDILLDSIRYCQNEKGLLLHGWCIMSNHVHLAVSAKNNNLSNVLRDFKKFTSKQIIKVIQNNQYESRKDWMLTISFPTSLLPNLKMYRNEEIQRDSSLEQHFASTRFWYIPTCRFTQEQIRRGFILSRLPAMDGYLFLRYQMGLMLFIISLKL